MVKTSPSKAGAGLTPVLGAELDMTEHTYTLMEAKIPHMFCSQKTKT